MVAAIGGSSFFLYVPSRHQSAPQARRCSCGLVRWLIRCRPSAAPSWAQFFRPSAALDVADECFWFHHSISSLILLNA